jgi:transcriptional regulator with XRE-family HTH domain
MSDSPSVHDPDELRDWRIRAGLSQSELAEATGLTQSYISLLERNKRKHPSAGTLKVIADVVGCDIDDLMLKRGRRRPKAAAGRPARVNAEPKGVAA